MGTILELIRYGLPGYLIVGTGIIVLARSGHLPTDGAFYAAFGSVIGGILLVVGPMLGFVVHQLYFVWFEARESYTNLSRRCLRTLYNHHTAIERSDGREANKKHLVRRCYLVWKYTMTGVMGDLPVSEILLSRLTSLRYYEHAFGAIVASALLAFGGYCTAAVAFGWQGAWVDLIALMCVGSMGLLFSYQRRGLSVRIEEIEDGVMRLEIDRFEASLMRIIELEGNEADRRVRPVDSIPRALLGDKDEHL